MKDLFGLGYKLYVDNWYSSETLFRYLEENGTAACGTVRANRLSLPDPFKKAPLPKGEYRLRRSGNVLAVRFHGKKEIYILSTIHTMKSVNTGKKNLRGDNIEKLHIIHDNNQKMDGVDKNDAVVGNYSCVRKSYKWTTKVFLHYLEEAMFNSYIIYKKTGGKKRFLQYKLAVIEAMLREAEVNIEVAGSGEN